MVNARFQTAIRPLKIRNTITNLISYFNALLFKQSKNSPYPTFLSIEISSRCNLSCPECPCGMNMIHRDTPLFDFKLFERILHESGPYINTVILYFQGEPTLHPRFTDFIKLAHQYHIFTSSSTNGQLIDTNKAKAIVESKLKHLVLSIDGTTQETYEIYRQGGSLQKTIDSINYINYWKKQLKSKYPIIEMQMVVFKHNESQIDDFKKLAQSLQVKNITFKTAQVYNLETIANLIPENKKYTRYVYLNNEWKLKKQLKNHCFRLWSGAVINSDGLILPCCFDKLSKYSFGSIKESSIKDIWNNDAIQKFRKDVFTKRAQIDICKNCDE